MSVLNLALSNTTLARELMDDEFESNMKKCNSMSSVRKMAESLKTSPLGATDPSTHVVADASIADVVEDASASAIVSDAFATIIVADTSSATVVADTSTVVVADASAADALEDASAATVILAFIATTFGVSGTASELASCRLL